jgi:NarL family two-component system response regulator LiaR
MNDPTTISILVVDNNEIFQSGIQTALAGYPDIHVSDMVKDGDAALLSGQYNRPDVIIVDIMIPGCEGTDLLRVLQHQLPKAHMIVLTHHRTVELVHDAFASGALCYLMKDTTVEQLVHAIREASQGNTVIAYEIAQALIQKPRNSSLLENKLTAREQEVMQLLMKGYKNGDIAEELVITLATVKKHVRKILTKLEVGSRTEAVAVAFENKFAGL